MPAKIPKEITEIIKTWSIDFGIQNLLLVLDLNLEKHLDLSRNFQFIKKGRCCIEQAFNGDSVVCPIYSGPV
jgi:rRNA maturation endonuclease Nob1